MDDSCTPAREEAAEPKRYTLASAARLLGAKPAFLYQLRREGLIFPSILHNGRRYLSEKDLEAVGSLVGHPAFQPSLPDRGTP
jgi:hypothetical protein